MPEIAYRSTHPDVLAHWAKTGSAEAQKTWRDNIAAAIAELGFAGERRFVTVSGWNDTRVIGVEHPKDEDIPVGWKPLKDFPGAVTPDKRRAAGKRAAARLDSLPCPNPRKRMPGGMPSMTFIGAKMAQPGVGRHGDAVYVTWSAELEESEASNLDPAVWERVKLSEYYAAKEQHEAVSL
jgi:hypothetical protein